MGPDGFRPPGDAFNYQSVYVMCLLVLIGITWVLCKFFKQGRVRVAVMSFALCFAVCGAVILREEYKISRIEIAHRFMSRLLSGELSFPAALRGVDGVTVNVTRDGVIYSTFGTPQETEEKLRQKYDHWFSGSIVKIRNALVPTIGSSVFLTRGTPLAGQEARQGSESAEP